jgi:hypothetical protein
MFTRLYVTPFLSMARQKESVAALAEIRSARQRELQTPFGASKQISDHRVGEPINSVTGRGSSRRTLLARNISRVLITPQATVERRGKKNKTPQLTTATEFFACMK